MLLTPCIFVVDVDISTFCPLKLKFLTQESLKILLLLLKSSCHVEIKCCQ